MPYLDEQSQRLNIRPSRVPTEIERKVFVGRVSVAKKKPPLVSNLSGIKVVSAGVSPGSKWVPNEALNALGCDAEWIYQRTGIQGRYHVAEGESTSDMAIRAAEQCLEKAGVAASEVDLIIVATVTPDYPTPSTGMYCPVTPRMQRGGLRFKCCVFRFYVWFGDRESGGKNGLQSQCLGDWC